MPQVTGAEMVRFLVSQGFIPRRQVGSHLTLVHPDGRQVTVPLHQGKDLGRGIAVSTLRLAGYSPDDFIRLR